MNPSVGRIVHFVMKNGDARPAIVVAHFGGDRANLRVFTDGSNDARNLDESPVPETLWRTSVPFSEEPKPDTWHWPPRVA